MVIVYFGILLFIILIAGFIMVTGSAIINWVFDEAIPEVTDLGMIGTSNMTTIASYTITPLNNILQSFTWLTGVLYIMMLVGSVGIVIIFRTTPNRWLIGFYLAMVLLLIIGSMYMSNIYEEFYNDAGTFGNILKEHMILSFMILYSPIITTVIAFITGIILFSGVSEESYV